MPRWILPRCCSVTAWPAASHRSYFGAVAGRAGARRTVTVGLAISVAASLLMANAGSLAAMNGFGQAAGWPGLVKNVGSRFAGGGTGVVMGWWSANYGALFALRWKESAV